MSWLKSWQRSDKSPHALEQHLLILVSNGALESAIGYLIGIPEPFRARVFGLG